MEDPSKYWPGNALAARMRQGAVPNRVSSYTRRRRLPGMRQYRNPQNPGATISHLRAPQQPLPDCTAGRRDVLLIFPKMAFAEKAGRSGLLKLPLRRMFLRLGGLIGSIDPYRS